MVWPQLFVIQTTTIGLILHPEGLDCERRRGSGLIMFWPCLLKKQDFCITATTCLSVCHYRQWGRSLLPNYIQLSRGQSFEDVKFLQVPQKLAAEQREEIRVKTSAQRAALTSLDPEGTARQRHGPAAQGARARCSTTSDTTAYFGPCLFYNWNLVATITFKLLSAHYVISKQHWNEIRIWKLWFLGPSTWKWWCQRPIYRISIL